MGKILILGGTGAMGVYLLERLKQTEHEVYVTSRSGHPDEGNIHYIEGNAKDDDFLLPLLANGYDCIIDFMVYSTFEFVDRYKQLLAATKQYISFLPTGFMPTTGWSRLRKKVRCFWTWSKTPNTGRLTNMP